MFTDVYFSVYQDEFREQSILKQFSKAHSVIYQGVLLIKHYHSVPVQIFQLLFYYSLGLHFCGISNGEHLIQMEIVQTVSVHSHFSSITTNLQIVSIIQKTTHWRISLGLHKTCIRVVCQQTTTIKLVAIDFFGVLIYGKY